MKKYVVKRDGNRQLLKISKITRRIEKLSEDLEYIEVELLMMNILNFICNNITTYQIDELTIREALGLYFKHNDYGKLAARLCIDNHNKTIEHKYGFKNLTENLGLRYNLNSCIINHAKYLQQLCETYHLPVTYSGYFKMKNSFYLMNFKNEDTDVYETVDYSIMRTAVSLVCGTNKWQLDKDELQWVRDIYRGICSRYITFSTPVYLNSGYEQFQGSSCIVIHVDDSLDSINLGCATTSTSSKYSSGIGINLGYIRGRGQKIRGTRGTSDGITPLARVLDSYGKYINQGGGKRPGSISPYIPCWHMDLLEVLSLRNDKDVKNAQTNHMLYYAVWMSDLFLRALIVDAEWYFFSPDDVPKLNTLHDSDFTLNYGDRSGAFTRKYFKYVEQKRYKSVMRAREVADKIGEIWAISGIPYICGKDQFNRCANQNTIIRSSNLCTEIAIPSGLNWDRESQSFKNEVGVCNLGSVCLPKFIKKREKYPEIYEKCCELWKTRGVPPLVWKVETFETQTTLESETILESDNKTQNETILKSKVVEYFFNEVEFEHQVRTLVRTVDNLIDINYYPLKETEFSNKKRRPLAIGKLGGADALCKLKIPYARGGEFNAQMQEALYYYAVCESCDMATVTGNIIAEYDEYKSASGLLQPHLYARNFPIKYAQRYNWDALGQKCKSGMHNSVLCANMPTGNVSLLMDMSPSFEPYESNIYKHSALTEDPIIINKRMRKDIMKIIPDPQICEKVMEELIPISGRIGGYKFPKPTWTQTQAQKSYYYAQIQRLREIYKVARFEITPREIIDVLAAAQPYCDQAQSINIWTPQVGTLHWNNIIYAAAKGLKTWVYYTKSSSGNKEEVCKSCVL